MQEYIYYVDLMCLGFSAASSAFLVVGSVVQLVLLNFRGPRIEGGNLFVFTQLLRASVVLAAQVLLIVWLRANTVSPWIIFVLAVLLGIASPLMRRYSISKSPWDQAEFLRNHSTFLGDDYPSQPGWIV